MFFAELKFEGVDDVVYERSKCFEKAFIQDLAEAAEEIDWPEVSGIGSSFVCFFRMVVWNKKTIEPNVLWFEEVLLL